MIGRAAAVALGAGLLAAACGSASTVTGASPSSAVPTLAPLACQDGSARLVVGQTLRLSCGAGVRAIAAGTVLRQVGSYAFEGIRPGSTTITLVRGPACSRGTLCPDYVEPDGAVAVTVAARP